MGKCPCEACVLEDCFQLVVQLGGVKPLRSEDKRAEVRLLGCALGESSGPDLYSLSIFASLLSQGEQAYFTTLILL